MYIESNTIDPLNSNLFHIDNYNESYPREIDMGHCSWKNPIKYGLYHNSSDGQAGHTSGLSTKLRTDPFK